MLRKMCQRGLLAGVARAAASNEGILGKAMSIILGEKEESYTGRVGKPDQPIQEEDYSRVFEYWKLSYPSSPLYHHSQLPVPPHAIMLGLTVDYIREIRHKGRIYSDFSMHAGNSSITYWVDEQRLSYNGGFIQQMWTMWVGIEQRTFISVRPHTRVPTQDRKGIPFTDERKHFNCEVIYTSPESPKDLVIIEPSLLRSHVAYYQRPAKTFGIGRPTTVLVDSLHRRRF
jgi:hypothetical protein